MFDHQFVGSSPSHKVGEVVFSALPARLLMDDTQAYIHNPVLDPGVGGNGPWKNSLQLEVAFTLGLVCLHKKKFIIKRKFIFVSPKCVRL